MALRTKRKQILTDDAREGMLIDIAGAFYKIHKKVVNDYGNWVFTLGHPLQNEDWELILIIPSQHGIEIITEWGGEGLPS